MFVNSFSALVPTRSLFPAAKLSSLPRVDEACPQQTITKFMHMTIQRLCVGPELLSPEINCKIHHRVLNGELMVSTPRAPYSRPAVRRSLCWPCRRQRNRKHPLHMRLVHTACEYALVEKTALRSPLCPFHFGCVPVDKTAFVEEDESRRVAYINWKDRWLSVRAQAIYKNSTNGKIRSELNQTTVSPSGSEEQRGTPGVVANFPGTTQGC